MTKLRAAGADALVTCAHDNVSHLRGHPGNHTSADSPRKPPHRHLREGQVRLAHVTRPSTPPPPTYAIRLDHCALAGSTRARTHTCSAAANPDETSIILALPGVVFSLSFEWPRLFPAGPPCGTKRENEEIIRVKERAAGRLRTYTSRRRAETSVLHHGDAFVAPLRLSQGLPCETTVQH